MKSNYELERGKPMPSKNHSLVQILLGTELVNRYREKYTILSELSLKLDEFTSTPDLCLYPRLPINWIHDEVKMTDPPLLIIEILSSKQSVDELVQKIEKYFEHGVKSCWLVQPVLGAITVFTPDMKPHIFSSGEVVDPTCNIRVSLENIF